MNVFISLIIFSSFSVVSSLFLSTYFFVSKRKKSSADKILGLLFFAITVRATKSVFSYASISFSFPGMAFGLLGVALIGPLIWLYFKNTTSSNETFRKEHLVHFILPIIGFIIMLIPGRKSYDIYLAATVLLGLYLSWIGFKYFMSKKNISELSNWSISLYISCIALFIIFLLQMLIRTAQFYAIGVALISVVLYVIFFFAIKPQALINTKPVLQISEDLKGKIKQAIEKDKIYLQPAITLAQFSESIKTPAYLVSKATKTIYKKNFPEVINSFRIKEVTLKLSQNNSINENIESLAYDVGFKTPSAFYLAFKKETSMTPRAYQKLHQNNHS